MTKLEELRKLQQDLNEKLDRVVKEIYEQTNKVKVGDLFFNEDEYYKVLKVDKYTCTVLVYSFINNIPYVDIADYNCYQLGFDKVKSDNGTFKKLVKYLNNLV